MYRAPPISTRTDPLFPNTPLFRSGRNRKGRRNAEDGGAVIAQRPIQVGKAQVVADGEAHQPERRLDSDAPCPARIGDGFAPALAGRKVDVEEMDLVIARADVAPVVDQEAAIDKTSVVVFLREGKRAEMDPAAIFRRCESHRREEPSCSLTPSAAMAGYGGT